MGARRAGVSGNASDVIAGMSEETLEGMATVARLLDANGLDVNDIGSIKAVKLNEWQGMVKGEDGEPRIIDMKGASLVLHPSWDSGPKWPVVQPAQPVVVKIPRATGSSRGPGWLKALILPDLQVGFRRDVATGELEPFHDLRAIDIALQICAVEKPDLIIILGDGLDFAPFGKYIQEPMFALTVQPALDYLHSLLATLRAMCPDAEIRFIEGNHDMRLQTSIMVNAAAAFGIRQANIPGAWPVLSVPHLLRFDDLGIEYVSGYPAGATYINDNLACVHGSRVKSAGSTAALVIDDERVSTIFGHVHRIETVYKTRNTRGKPKFNMAHTPGCLCRIDGIVPGVKSGIDPYGHHVKHFENWQQSVSLVDYQPGDGKFHLDNTPIFEGWAMHRDGREFYSRVDIQGEKVAA